MGRCWLMLLVIFLLGGCAPDEPVRPKAQREEEKETPDPVVEVEGIWAFAGVGADIEAPVGAENARYFIVGDAVAEIRFVRNDVAYSYKASKSEADLNAQQGGAREVEGVQAQVDDHAIPIQETDGGLTATWRWGSVSYSLTAEGPVDVQIMRTLVEELARETMPAKI